MDVIGGAGARYDLADDGHLLPRHAGDGRYRRRSSGKRPVLATALPTRACGRNLRDSVPPPSTPERYRRRYLRVLVIRSLPGPFVLRSPNRYSAAQHVVKG